MNTTKKLLIGAVALAAVVIGMPTQSAEYKKPAIDLKIEKKWVRDWEITRPISWKQETNLLVTINVPAGYNLEVWHGYVLEREGFKLVTHDQLDKKKYPNARWQIHYGWIPAIVQTNNSGSHVFKRMVGMGRIRNSRHKNRVVVLDGDVYRLKKEEVGDLVVKAEWRNGTGQPRYVVYVVESNMEHSRVKDFGDTHRQFYDLYDYVKGRK